MCIGKYGNSVLYVSFHNFCRWKEAVDFTSFDDLQNLFEFVVKFKNRDIKVSQSDIEVMSQWITPNDMTDALFEVKHRTPFFTRTHVQQLTFVYV